MALVIGFPVLGLIGTFAQTKTVSAQPNLGASVPGCTPSIHSGTQLTSTVSKGFVTVTLTTVQPQRLRTLGEKKELD